MTTQHTPDPLAGSAVGPPTQAIIETDTSGIITRWDGTAEAVYGWRVDEVMGRAIYDVMVPDLAQ